MPIDLNQVLITGVGGMVGRYADFGIRPSREELDITHDVGVADLVGKVKPSAILHLAALTDLKYCEEHPEEAHRVNAESTKVLAEAAASVGARFIYLSTNAVFEGKTATPYDEDDMPAPVNAYGKSKLAGETVVKKYVRDWLIVRTGWVFGGGRDGDKRFVGKIIGQLTAPEIKAVDDNRGTPTYAKDLMQKIKELIREDRTGIVHVTNGGIASRFEQAKFIADFFGYQGRLTSLHLRDFPSIPAPLQNEALVSKTIQLRPWQEALSEYLKTEWK